MSQKELFCNDKFYNLYVTEMFSSQYEGFHKEKCVQTTCQKKDATKDPWAKSSNEKKRTRK